jgi:FMN phosphatase YigB (HAD superfamily)
MLTAPVALIFDLDDTLIPSSVFYVQAVAYALGQNPKLISYYEDARLAVKADLPPLHTSARNRLLYFKRLIEFSGDQDHSPLALCDAYEKELSRLIFAWSLAEKRLELIRRFQARYPCYILTNETIRAQLLKIEALCQNQKHGFQGIICSEEVGCEKPDHRIFNVIFKRFKLDPTHCIFVGDSFKNDIAAGREVGLYPIQTLEFIQESGRNHKGPVIHHLSELLGLLP